MNYFYISKRKIMEKTLPCKVFLIQSFWYNIVFNKHWMNEWMFSICPQAICSIPHNFLRKIYVSRSLVTEIRHYLQFLHYVIHLPYIRNSLQYFSNLISKGRSSSGGLVTTSLMRWVSRSISLDDCSSLS